MTSNEGFNKVPEIAGMWICMEALQIMPRMPLHKK